MLPMKNILFLCTGNACRSQMAEAWANKLHSNIVNAYSAGTNPHGLDPSAVSVMQEVGIDMSKHYSKSLDDISNVGFETVITVCDAAAEGCPIFPGMTKTIHQGFPDPPKLALGLPPDARLEAYREVRDEIRKFIEGLPEFLKEHA